MLIKRVRTLGITIIVISTIISEIVANLPQEYEQGLFGVSQIFAPLMFGTIGIIFFLVLSKIINNKIVLWLSIILISSYIVYIGFSLYF